MAAYGTNSGFASRITNYYGKKWITLKSVAINVHDFLISQICLSFKHIFVDHNCLKIIHISLKIIFLGKLLNNLFNEYLTILCTISAYKKIYVNFN